MDSVAGDWIKMLTDLHTNPKIVRMERSLSGADQREVGAIGAQKPALARAKFAEVCGACYMLWSLADKHAVRGKLKGYTFEFIDQHVGVPGFAAAYADVGWMTQDIDGVTLVNFHKHNGKTAKKRASDAKRAAKYRQTGVTLPSRSHHAPVTLPSRSDATKSAPEQSRAAESRAEKRREEKSSNAAAQNLSLRGTACSLLAAAGLDDGAIAAILANPRADECTVQWAAERLHAAMVAGRRGGKSVRNPGGYIRDLIEHKSPPSGWRTAWNQKRIEQQYATLNGSQA